MKIRNVALIGGSLLMSAFMPHSNSAPDKWAVVIGISDYKNFGPEIGGDLPGASWDARRMRDVLVERRGFSPDHVHMVLDTLATKARIEHEVTAWLPSVVKDGDEVTIFFAGHGSQEWDTNGDEADGLDETICPTDVTKSDTRMDISDDEIEQWLNKIPTHNMSVVLDNCHAGSGTRAVTPFARPRALNRIVTRDVPKPANATPPATTPAAANASAINASGWDEYAAAQADEVAVDAEWPGENGAPSTYGGAFTTNFVRNLWNVSRHASYKEVFAMTVEDMKRERFAQQPIFTANPNPEKASAQNAADSLDDGFVPVTAVAGTTVTLAGGNSAGITLGSVYRAGNAMLRVTTVKPDAATATIVTGNAPSAGMPARLSSYVYPQSQLKVSVANLDPATRAAIEAATHDIPGLVIVSQPRDFAHLLLRPATDGYSIIGMDGAIRHADIKGRGALAATEIAKILRDEAGANMIASLDNPGETHALDFAFAGGKTDFTLNDAIAFNITAPMAGYLTVVDLGTDGAITVLYPQKGENNQVKVGQVVRLPQTDSYQALPPAGRGIVRAFVTKRPMNIKYDGNGSTDASTVAAALRAAAGATSPTTGIPVDTWTTASLVYTVSKK